MANSKLAMACAELESAHIDTVIEIAEVRKVLAWLDRRLARRATALVNAGNDVAALRAAKERLQAVG